MGRPSGTWAAFLCNVFRLPAQHSPVGLPAVDRLFQSADSSRKSQYLSERPRHPDTPADQRGQLASHPGKVHHNDEIRRHLLRQYNSTKRSGSAPGDQVSEKRNRSRNTADLKSRWMTRPVRPGRSTRFALQEPPVASEQLFTRRSVAHSPLSSRSSISSCHPTFQFITSLKPTPSSEWKWQYIHFDLNVRFTVPVLWGSPS